ncbi:ABC transporter permease [Streptomyces sp. MBT65]|uniref:ABC transporter permease n=1 Tax=Streptomyces sp. MBT65 TaxID=1488395 RepID=UPI00190B51E3|nr:ABC transporter permease [Streptomyces sp. MBT65]MBK3581034.1 ABC transporter permease [Streptomyces sp. MBT65]
MLSLIIRRLVHCTILFLSSVVLTYTLASAALDPRAYFEGRQPPPPSRVVDAELSRLGMDDRAPLPERFAHWADRAAHGDLGRTIDGESVNAEFGRRVGVSLRLLLVGTVTGTVVGVLAGVWAAVRRGGLGDRALTVFSFAVLCVPTFVLALLLKTGALSVNRAAGSTVILYTGEHTPGLQAGWPVQLRDTAAHLLLPAICVAIPAIATYSRYQRAATLDVLGADHLRTAQAKGLTPGRALLRHGLRISLVPVSVFFSFGVLTLFTGAVFTEEIFGWPGMGSWLVDSVQKGDVNSVVAIDLFAAAVVLLAGLLADVVHALLDPRVRQP